MHIDIKPVFHLTVSADELRLIGMGLARKLKGTDIEAARLLNQNLLEQRMKHLNDMAQAAETTLRTYTEREGNKP